MNDPLRSFSSAFGRPGASGGCLMITGCVPEANRRASSTNLDPRCPVPLHIWLELSIHGFCLGLISRCLGDRSYCGGRSCSGMWPLPVSLFLICAACGDFLDRRSVGLWSHGVEMLSPTYDCFRIPPFSEYPFARFQCWQGVNSQKLCQEQCHIIQHKKQRGFPR